MADRQPEYESIDWSTIEQRFQDGALRGKLMRLAATLTSIGIALLVINLIGLFWLRYNVTDLVENRAPLVDATRQAQTGMQRSLAGLRGWVALPDPRFQEERRTAWSGGIEPAMQQIDALMAESPDATGVRMTLAAISTGLDDLAESQWWVADVAQTAGNEPAQVAYEHSVLPVRRDLEASLLEIGELAHDGQATKEGDGPLAALLLFQMRLAAADAALHEFIQDGTMASRWTFEQNIDHAQALLADVSASLGDWEPLSAEHISALARELPWYIHHARKAVERRTAPDWNIAKYLMQQETVPLTRALSSELNELADRQAALMQTEADHVSLAGNITVAVSVVLIALMAITAYALTNRRAEQITRPLHQLSQATLLLAKGELTENLPITTNDELGKLTVAFNHMRVSLHRTEAALRRANDRMAAELASAADYVQSALPRRLSTTDKGVLTDWTFIASAELGGDSFGYHWIDDEHFAIYLLDVCGHGVGPAMLSISAHNALRQRTLPATNFRRPNEVLKALNRAFPMRENHNKFFTIWYGVYNTTTSELSYACGGHHPALLFDRAKDESVELGMKGFMIGVLDDAEFESASVTVTPGSRLYVFSDGLFEIRNEAKEMLYVSGFKGHLQVVQHQGADRLEAVLTSIRQYQDADDFNDDYSLLEVSFS